MSWKLLAPFIASMILACTNEIVSWEEPPDTGGEEERREENEQRERDDGEEDNRNRSRSDDDREDEDDDDENVADDDERSGRDDDGDEVDGIPVGQMPPPGSCRIWYPNRSPGHQPPPGRCDDLRGNVPDGAWLLYRPNDEPRVYRIE